ncbi:MAG TPA: phosphoenolpyruvate mutase [Nitrospirales bacterium]|nr:phosphoenolpyruvate mutase [Nitrospirales bacterium]
MRHRPSLREKLHEPGLLAAVGSHDALSAKLIEEAGFDAIWAGGFGISAAQKCVPDASGLTMTETLDVSKNLAEAANIPVIVDGDTGYGNAINVMRTVADFEKAGIAGLCIEDNVFPKRCSFYAGVKRELVSVEEFAGKIRAAKAAQAGSDFVVIARTEALIAGWGMAEALRRADAYAEAGADAILVHSKSSTFDELRAFASTWNIVKPLVIVPTIFPDVTESELEKAGFKLVIYANQLLRAIIKTSRESLEVLRKGQAAAHLSDRIVPLKDVYQIVGVSQLESDERNFLPVGAEDVTAVIVAAGFDQNLMPLIKDRPKCLLDIKGQSILEHQITALNECNIKRIAVVRGYLKDTITIPNLRYYDNDDYENTGELFSLFSAEPELTGKVIVMYSDIVFEPVILEKLLRSPADVTLVVDHAWYDNKREGLAPPHLNPDLVKLKTAPTAAYRFVPDDDFPMVEHIGQQLDHDQAHGEFIGMAMFSEQGTECLKQGYHAALEQYQGKAFHESPTLREAAFTDMVQELIGAGLEVACVKIYKGWMEVDTFEDYQRAWATIRK